MKKVFIILFTIFCFQNSFSQDEPEVIKVSKEVKIEDNKVYTIAQSQPLFPGGDSALFAYLGRQIIYPDSLKEKGISGNVYCQFIVEKDGTITNEKIMSSPDPGFDPTVLKAVRNMPKWKSGMQFGKAVRVRFVLPIHFNLR